MRPSKHGTWAGYQLGCRLDCCTSAARNYQKGRVIDAHRGLPRTVSCVGTRRRVEALACLGWSGYDISVRLGHGREWLRQVLACDVIHRRTHDRIAGVYEALAMTMPLDDTPIRRQMIGRTKARARRNGWLPPLAWDDIDDPDEVPNMGRDSTLYRSEELVAEWSHLRAGGVSIDAAASQLGVSTSAIEKAIERTRKESAA